MLDEAIRRNITELVASAFGGHTPGAGTENIGSPGMEVQEVTVYVNNRPNPNSLNGDDQAASGSFGIPSNRFKESSVPSNEGSISIQNVPFIPPRFAPSSNENNQGEKSNNSKDDRFKQTSSPTVSII